MFNVQLCETGRRKDIEKYHLKGYIAQQKIDGCRCLAICLNGEVRLLGRTGSNYTSKFPEIVEELKEFNAVFDGEIMCDTFEHTLSRVHTDNKLKTNLLVSEYPAKYHIFDLLNRENRDLRAEPLYKRLLFLQEMPLQSKKWLEVVKYTDDLIYLWEKALQMEWEGIIIKKLDSKYEGRRTWNWIKIKAIKSKDLMVNKYSINPAGIRAETNEGLAVQISGSNSQLVKKQIDETGSCKIEVNYLNVTNEGKLRQIVFKDLKDV